MLLNDLADYHFYLASKSPRRHELLKGMGIDFTYYQTDVEERYPADLSPVQVVEYLSQLKLSKVDFENRTEKEVFIACDTIVVFGGKVIGKPKDRDDALRMLKMLAGQEHTVVSGLTVATPKRRLTSHSESKVKFADVSDSEIEYYVNHYQPFDKAGSYGVQEWFGYVGIDYIRGSFYNVMGLPTRLLWQMIQEICEK